MAIVPDPDVEPDDSVRMTPAYWKEKVEAGIGMLASAVKLSVDIKLLVAEHPPEGEILNDLPREYDLDYDGYASRGSFIGFEVTIPRRRHRALVPFMTVDSLECERFHVAIIGTNFGPVTFVRALEGISDRYAGDSLIVLVRNFLKEEFKSVGAPVTLVTVGPSPFHVKMSLAPRSATDLDLEFKWESRQWGYDEAVFFYDETVESAVDVWARIVVTSLADAFGRYYKFARSRQRRYLRANFVSGLAKTLVKHHAKSGLRGWFRKIFRTGVLARGLMLAAIQAKQIEVDELRQAQEALQDFSSSFELEQLEKACMKEARSSYATSLESSAEIAKTLESGRLKNYEVVILAASTTLGGLAGAIAALIAT